MRKYDNNCLIPAPLSAPYVASFGANVVSEEGGAEGRGFPAFGPTRAPLLTVASHGWSERSERDRVPGDMKIPLGEDRRVTRFLRLYVNNSSPCSPHIHLHSFQSLRRMLEVKDRRERTDEIRPKWPHIPSLSVHPLSLSVVRLSPLDLGCDCKEQTKSERGERETGRIQRMNRGEPGVSLHLTVSLSRLLTHVINSIFSGLHIILLSGAGSLT